MSRADGVARGAGGRRSEALEEGQAAREEAREEAIAVADLRFRYPGAAADTLTGVSFAVRPGEVFGLLGPSGVGKTTTQRALIGLQRGYRGAARVLGRDVRTWGRDLYERIGVCFEAPTLYGRLTARENLTLFSALYAAPPRDPAALLAEVGLEDAADQRVSEFSKGMKIRLNLCRALLHDPDALFLDEPTSGQDPSRAIQVRRLIRGLADAGKAVFLTTHNMTDAAEICDRVGFLVGGALPVVGRPDELMRAYGAPRARVVDVDGAVSEHPLSGLGRDPAFQALLKADRIRSIRSLEATLEEVFVQVAAGAEATTPVGAAREGEEGTGEEGAGG